MNFLSLEKHISNKSNYSKDKIYRLRKLTSNAKPNFKLNAFCINLETKENNMLFIKNEWKDYLNVRRFVALNTATESHYFLLDWICENKDKIKFPIVIMEDDVFRKNNFVDYCNKIIPTDKIACEGDTFKQKNCDYIAFDNIFLQFNKENNVNIKDYFVSIKSHRSMGFIVYFKSFFDKYNDIKHLLNRNIPIDIYITNIVKFKKFVPRRQVCRQIVDKKSSTANYNTSHYNKYYHISKNILIEKFPDIKE